MSQMSSRAREIAGFLGIPETFAIERLSQGFGYLHQCVTDDFRRFNPVNDQQLLEWYRLTEEYIWELSAYHMDERFNYERMCCGIADRLHAEGADKVLCLGDGIGDLTILLDASDLNAVYHDLSNSLTAKFFLYRSDGDIPTDLTDRWAPELTEGPYDAIVSLDFLEHVTDLPVWTQAIYNNLRPGGLFVAQNAFACGSGEDGAIPMHLERNDKYAHASAESNGLALWDHLLFGHGFTQLGPQWYRRP